MKEKNNLINILEKDKVWNKIKKYIYIFITLFVVFIILFLGVLIMQYITLQKIIDYTSSLV
jgi:hypothetical protein